MKNLLEIKDLHKTFHLSILGDKEIEAIRGASCEIRQGEIIGLTGKSGSGKSSLMKCIYRTYLSSSGNILYHSEQFGMVDLATCSEHLVLKVRGAEMTYCSQFLSVIPRVPAVQVVAESLLHRGLSEKEAREGSMEYLGQLGLPRELWDAFPATFSGGEQQRINVARAIISEPRFLLIDEPTASLDPKTKDVVIQLILKMREKGTTVMLITHDQYSLESLSDRRFHLADGVMEEVSVAETISQ